MPPDPRFSIIEQAVTDRQIAVRDGSLIISPDAPDAVVDVVGGFAGDGRLYRGDRRRIYQPIPLVDQEPIAAVMERITADLKIKAKYDQIGGIHSPLGLPFVPNLAVQQHGSTFFTDFRGGRIEITDSLGPQNALAIKRFGTEIWWVGTECVVRQENPDEIYGSIGCMVNGTGQHMTHKFPADRDAWTMGPAGMRLFPVGVKLYDGPPMDLTVVVSLVEHDSGDIEKYKSVFAEQMARAAQGLGAMAGVPAEATAATAPWINDLSLGLVNVITDALGLPDDPYNPGHLLLHWTDIQGQRFLRQSYNRPGQPQTIPAYTHRLEVTGHDGSNFGHYNFYFDVRLSEVSVQL